jgi:acetyl-CoA carboxylase biotin carboxyl carrier protein
MNIELLKSIIEVFEQSSLSKLQIEHLDLKISMERNLNSVEVTPVGVEPQKKAVVVEGGKLIKAPVVGTFYLAPAPDAEPFVKVGQSIKAGEVVGIIEAMKVMNEITSDVSGVVNEILVTSGSVVGYQQPLIKVL